MKKEFLEFLKHHPLFEGITEQELLSLLPLLRVEIYDPGTFIVKEGEEGGPLYLIKEGSVEVIKQGDDKDIFYRLNTLSSNTWFGEISFLEESQRQASIRALETTEVISLSLKEVSRLASGGEILSKLSSCFAKQLGSNLKSANTLAIESLQQELNLTRINGEVGRTLVYLFILLTIFVYIMRIVENTHLPSFVEYSLDSSVIVCIGLIAISMLRNSPYPFEFYGITLKNWKQNAKEAILYTLPWLVGMIVLKWWLIHSFKAFENLKMFGVGSTPSFFFSWVEPTSNHLAHWVGLGVYIVLVPIQELLARGWLQGCLSRFFQSSHRVLLSIIISNLVFTVFHNLKTIAFSLVAGALGLFWGWLYYKQKSLVGPIVSHALIGIVGLGILDYSRILS